MIRRPAPAPIPLPGSVAGSCVEPALAGSSERLRVLPSAGGGGYDLRRGGSDGPLVATLRPAPHLVILDAMLRRDDDGLTDVITSEFDVGLQRGRVVRWFDGPGGPASHPLFEGPPGSVLWWLHPCEGRLAVRDVRHGCSYLVDGVAAAPGVPYDRPSARRPA